MTCPLQITRNRQRTRLQTARLQALLVPRLIGQLFFLFSPYPAILVHLLLVRFLYCFYDGFDKCIIQIKKNE